MERYRDSYDLVLLAAAGIVTCLLYLVLSGCASMPRGEKVFIAATLADTATTVYGLTATDLHEVGPIHGAWGNDDAALVSVLVVDAALIYFVHRLYKRFPDWPGWPAVWYPYAGVKSLVAARNLKLIITTDASGDSEP